MTSALEFSSSWSLGEMAYRGILDDLRSIGAKSIVEFGSGTSTLRLSRDLPDASIFSIESDSAFLEQTRGDLELHGGSARVELVQRPLRWQRHGLSWFRSYQPGQFPQRIDAVLIDGPPIATRRGREACLYQVFANCHVGTRFYLDDYRRAAEQRTVLNWLRTYGSALIHLETFQVDDQVAVLERATERYARRFHWKNTADSVIQTTKQILRP
ncbi:MAG: hypothetical protein JRJ80_00260 [Deltaproteobacteria bacterium]|nr:hypothetical protein [Deltaproteobacteria bacterium]MBW1903702.1 hypothetical protein [Deltaproteobacteria bacterium]